MLSRTFSYMFLHFLDTRRPRGLMDGRLRCMASERIIPPVPKYHCHLMLISNAHRLANAPYLLHLIPFQVNCSPLCSFKVNKL